MTDDVRRALQVNAAILEMISEDKFGDIGRTVTINIDPPWRGTIGEALDLANDALEPEQHGAPSK